MRTTDSSFLPSDMGKNHSKIIGLADRIRNYFSLGQCTRWFFSSVGGLLLFCALQKLVNLPWSSLPFTTPFDLDDPVFGIRAKYLVLLTAFAELAIASLCLFFIPSPRWGEKDGIKGRAGFLSTGRGECRDQSVSDTQSNLAHYTLGLIAWFALNLLVYRAGLWFMGWHHPYSSLFYLTNGLGISPRVADALTCGTAIYFALGSTTLLWLLRRRDEAHQSLKISCHQCGGHIKFAAQNLGQTIPCPHCETAVVLRKPDENLKMSCFFCKGHIEFPTHAIGDKLQCPHCKKDITLKEPATV